MADAPKAYLLNEDGKVEAVDAEDAPDYLSTGYVPAGKSQIEDFKREEAFHAKYGTTGQQLKTFGEGAAQSLTLGASTWAERALGVKPEDIKGRQEENPKSHLAGSITGVALPLIATAGAAALPEGLAGAAELTAPSLISGLGESASEGVAGLLGEGAKSAVGRIAAKAAAAGAGSAIEGAAYGLGQVVHESALGDANLLSSRMLEEVGLSALLGGGIGAGMGVLGQLVGEGANSKLGQKLEEWLDQAEARGNLGQTAGGQNIRAQLKKDVQKLGWDNVNQMSREGRDLGLGSPLSSAQSNFDRAAELKAEAGQTMEATKSAVDASPEGIAAQPSAAKVAATARRDVLAPLKENFADTGTGERFEKVLGQFEDKFGAANPENKMTFSGLHEARQMLDKEIYGLKGDLTVNNNYKQALHDFRDLLSEEITDGLKKVPGDVAKDWAEANRKYQLASFFQKYAEKGLLGQKGNNLLPVTTWLPALFGHVTGGPLGGTALGVGGFLAKRYGPGALAEGARFARKLVDEGAAEGLASKTAEAISEAREAATEAVSTRAAQLWGKLTEKVGEPVGGPAKDLLRDTAQEHLAERGAGNEAAESSTGGPHGTPVETVAALSHMERASQRVQNRVGDGVAALVHGAPKVARGEAMAGVAATFAKSTEDAHAAYAKRAEKLRQLAANPQLLQERLVQMASGMDEHAPETAQALQVAAARCISVLNAALPPVRPHAPLEKPLPPSPDEVAAHNRVFEVVEKPSRLLKQAAACALTLEAVAAVKQAHPQYYADMQAAVLHKLSTHKGPIPYTQRQMLSLLMGQDMDGTQSPQAIAAHQAAFAVASPQQGSPAVKPTSKGLGKLKQSTRLLTPAQASAQRGNGGD